MAEGQHEPSHRDMANAIRALAMDGVEKAKSGHPGMPMGMADVATVLATRFLRFDAADPRWPGRDRLVLSAGHGSMLLYAILYLTGTEGWTLDDLKSFRQLGAKSAGHPEHGHGEGIETTTGPLGQGLANAVGMALAERVWNARLGDDLFAHWTYCIAGDGCLMEGISHEAIGLAGHLGLGRLIVLFDDNGITIDGGTALSTSEDQCARFAAAGWNTVRIDGHDPSAIAGAIEKAKADTSKPWLIACKTTIGFGAPTKAGKAASHGSPLGAAEIEGARKALGWPHAPFEVPAEVLDRWREAGSRGRAERARWQATWARLGPAQREAFEHPAQAAGEAVASAIETARAAAAAETAQKATRQWSEATLERLTAAQPALIGGSADLTGSNNTKAKAQKPITRADFSGSYIYYGIREHAMAAVMNGMALYGGIIPYGGTFLVFSDYSRPAIRLAALMRQRVVHVLTHDSIGLGEDGPTHQPVEHLAALRAIPDLLVMRPADGVETAECWAIAIGPGNRPSVLALTRQPVANLRKGPLGEHLSAKGAYVLLEPTGGRDVTLLATGSEVTLAVAAAELLAKEGLRAAVVSMPCFELFREQPAPYRDDVLGHAPRVGIEAAVASGWHEWLRPGDAFIGMSGFGASAPIAALLEHFGFTPAKVAERVRTLLTRPRA